MMLEESRYAIFKVGEKYRILEYGWYTNPVSFGDYIFTGWIVVEDAHKAASICHVLNNLTDPLAIKCFLELVHLS